jgi:uncharacterized protein (DUF1800 family)
MANSVLSALPADRWNIRTARHLLNRAGFGIPYSQVRGLLEMGPDAAVATFVDFDQVNEPNANPNFLVPLSKHQELRAMRRDESTVEQRREAQSALRKEERAATNQLKAWWLQRMMLTRRPLQEKLTLFWHGHFAVSAQKVKRSETLYQLHAIMRNQAAGNFKTLTTQVGQSPAMLRYLDNDKSNKKKPNENWARELMELFTMGVGNYTEDDIKQSARAFTGWASNGERFRYDENKHDFGDKTFMGRSGNLDGWDVINIIFEQPATAEHLAREFWTHFAYENPEDAIVKELAHTIRISNYEMKPALRQMFLSSAFYNEKAMGTQIKSPVQLALGLCSDMGMKAPSPAAVANASRVLGQDLFYPPNVKGWDGQKAWINANTLLTRYNLPGQLIGGQRKAEERRRKMAAMATPEMSPEMMLDGSAAEEVSTKKGAAKGRRQRGKQSDRPGATLNQAFKRVKADTAGECIDHLIVRYLNTPISQTQRNELVAALGAASPESPYASDKVKPQNKRAVMHLLFSTAEYQLC